MNALSNPDVKLLVLSFVDLFTLTRWSQASKHFIPSKIQENYKGYAVDCGGIEVSLGTSSSERSGFWEVANALWCAIGAPLDALQDARIFFPGSDDVAETFSVEVHFLGRPACQSIMHNGIRELSGMSHNARCTLLDSDSTPHEESDGFLELLEKENPENEDLANALAVLRKGQWVYELYHENWSTWHPDDTVASIRFEVHGLLGVILLSDTDESSGSETRGLSSDSEPCGLPPHVDDDLGSD